MKIWVKKVSFTCSEIFIFFFKDFFGKFKNGQKKCPNFKNGNTSWKKHFDETINFFSVSQVFETFCFVTVKILFL
jgi:hypothetical protein